MDVRRYKFVSYMLLAAPYLVLMGQSGYANLILRVLVLTLENVVFFGMTILLIIGPTIRIATIKWSKLSTIQRRADDLLAILLLLSVLHPLISMAFGIMDIRDFLNSVFSTAAILITILPIRLAQFQLIEIITQNPVRAVIRTIEIHILLIMITFAVLLPEPPYSGAASGLAVLGSKYALTIIYFQILAAWIFLGAGGLAVLGESVLKFLSATMSGLTITSYLGLGYVIGSYIAVIATRDGKVKLDKDATNIFLKAVILTILVIYVLKVISTSLISVDLLSGYAPWVMLLIFIMTVRGRFEEWKLKKLLQLPSRR